MLDTRYFKCVYEEVYTDPLDGIGYETTCTAFTPVHGQSMCLFSKVGGSPLAFLNLRYQDLSLYGNGQSSFITEIPSDSDDKQRFQGVVTKNGQNIELVITNLTDDYINFNLMKCDEKVDEVNPGGLNEVNELHGYESYAIRCDQTQGSRILKLDTGNSSVTLREEESKPPETKVGNYLYLSVVPLVSNQTQNTQFQDTYWKPVDYFVIRQKTYVEPETSNSGIEGVFERNIEGVFEINIGRVIERGEPLELCVEYNAVPCSLQCNSMTFTTGNDDTFGNYPANGYPANSNVEGTHDEMRDIIEDRCQMVMESKVARIGVGEEVINVETRQTGNNYDYDHHSKPCVLGFSVMENMVVELPPVDAETAQKEVKDLINSYLSRTYESFLSQTTAFVSDTCCVCLESNVDTLFYRCGHVCVDKQCSKNLAKCPLCRTNIMARVPYITNTA